MSGPASVASGNVSPHTRVALPSKLKTYGFIITIIFGITGLAIGSAGALSNVAQLDAIIMMAAGGGGGVILLIIGLVGIIKNRQSGSQQQHNNALSDSRDIGSRKAMSSTSGPASSDITSTTSVPMSSIHDSVTGTFDPAASIYGHEAWREAWKKWKNIEIADLVVPPPPTVVFDKKNQALLYIPKEVIVNGKKQNFHLKTLKEIVGDLLYLSPSIEKQFGEKTGSGSWILIDKTVISNSLGATYEAQQEMVENSGCSLPSALEAATLNLMIFGLTGERLYGQQPCTYTRCVEKVDGQYPAVIVGFASDYLMVGNRHLGFDEIGATRVRRKF